MKRALALKELREIAWIAALGLALNLAIVCNLTGWRLFNWVSWLPSPSDGIPFVSGDFLFFLSLVLGGLALALGLRQSAWEASRGTYLFLLHRPVSREWIFLIKIASGIGLGLLATLVPVAVYAWWAATPGHHASPFEWSMTVPAWHACAWFVPLYLAAFLTGIRPARWFGTRLLPLLAAGLFLTYALSGVASWSVGFGLALLVAGLYLIAILAAVRVRDYA
jgi:hypothetical protein